MDKRTVGWGDDWRGWRGPIVIGAVVFTVSLSAVDKTLGEVLEYSPTNALLVGSGSSTGPTEMVHTEIRETKIVGQVRYSSASTIGPTT